MEYQIVRQWFIIRVNEGKDGEGEQVGRRREIMGLDYGKEDEWEP